MILKIMRVKEPEILSIAGNSLWTTRESVQAVFLRRHNLEENQKAVKVQISENGIINNPRNWLLLIEGRKKYLTFENLYIDDLIDDFEIKSEDPIIQPFTEEIVNAVGIDKILAALSVFVMEYLDFIDQSKETVLEEDLKIFLDKISHAISKSFGISQKALQKSFLSLKWDDPNFWEEVSLFQGQRQKLIDKSNSLSKLNLLEILSRYQAPGIFIMSGIAHKPIFQ